MSEKMTAQMRAQKMLALMYGGTDLAPMHRQDQLAAEFEAHAAQAVAEREAELRRMTEDRDMWQELCSQLAAPQGEWALVPRVPTRDMLEAAAEAPDDDDWLSAMTKAYRAMLEAKPKPPDIYAALRAASTTEKMG